MRAGKKHDLMRPKQKYEKILLQREVDGKDFFQKHGGELVDTSCPACGERGSNLFIKYGFNHKGCDNCNTLFCSPRPAENLLLSYYKSYESPKMWTELLLEADTDRKMLQYMPRVKRIVDAVIKNGDRVGLEKTLDLGTGSGAFSMCLKNSDFFNHVIPMDLSDECVQACIRHGLDAVSGTVTDVADGSVDMICMNDLIEHVFDPYSFLRECFRALSNNGYVYIATPNGLGFDFRILKDETKI